MGVFRSKTVDCPAGKWTSLISNFGTGMPKTFTIAFTPENGEDVSGEFEEKKYFWIFPGRTLHGPLVPLMEFQRDWINGIYRVRVKPDSRVTAEFK